MFDMKKVPLPDYSRREDIVNSITHAVGVPLCIAGFFLLLKVEPIHSVRNVFSAVIYLGSALLVFLGSAIYHGMRPGYAKKVARVLDHSNIYIMIAGMTTSFNLTHIYPLEPTKAKISIAVIWAASVVGILLTFMDLKRFNVPQIFMYVILGWASVFSIKSVWSAGSAGRAYVTMVLIGGACITVGSVLYFVGKKLRYFHAVFHLFVLAGNIIIYIGTYNLCAAG